VVATLHTTSRRSDTPEPPLSAIHCCHYLHITGRAPCTLMLLELPCYLLAYTSLHSQADTLLHKASILAATPIAQQAAAASACMAAGMFTMPQPTPLFLWPLPAGNWFAGRLALVFRACLTAEAGQLGRLAHTMAVAADTWGVAMEVPLRGP
jgi:hypothetical protein